MVLNKKCKSLRERKGKERSWRNTAYSLSPSLCWARFLIQPRTTCLRVSLPTVGWTFSVTQQRKCPTDMTQSNPLEGIPQLRLSLPHMSGWQLKPTIVVYHYSLQVFLFFVQLCSLSWIPWCLLTGLKLCSILNSVPFSSLFSVCIFSPEPPSSTVILPSASNNLLLSLWEEFLNFHPWLHYRISIWSFKHFPVMTFSICLLSTLSMKEGGTGKGGGGRGNGGWGVKVCLCFPSN